MSSTRKNDESLSRVVKIVIVVMLVCLGLWGCARKPSAGAASSQRVQALEGRCQKLDQDYRQVASARTRPADLRRAATSMWSQCMLRTNISRRDFWSSSRTQEAILGTAFSAL